MVHCVESPRVAPLLFLWPSVGVWRDVAIIVGWTDLYQAVPLLLGTGVFGALCSDECRAGSRRDCSTLRYPGAGEWGGDSATSYGAHRGKNTTINLLRNRFFCGVILVLTGGQVMVVMQTYFCCHQCLQGMVEATVTQLSWGSTEQTISLALFERKTLSAPQLS